MKKLILLMLVLALTAVAGTALATPVDELTAPAEYFPEDSFFFAVIRTDAGYIETLDGVLSSVLDKFPQDQLPPDANLNFLLDEAVSDFTDKPESTFADDVRPWLGDWVAAGVTSVEAAESPNGLTFIIDIADRDAAAAFLEAELVADTGGFSYYDMIELEDGTLEFLSEYSIDPVVRLMEDKLLIGDAVWLDELVGIATDGPALSESEDFAAATAALPQDDYNIIAYVDTEPIITVIADEFEANPPQGFPSINLGDYTEALGQVAVGFTILEGRSLTIDLANTGGELVAEMTATPIDLSLLERLSDQTSLVIQGSGLGGQVQKLIDGLYALDATLKEEGVLPIPDVSGFLADFGTDDIAAFLQLTIEGTYRIDLEETLAWMNGDTVLSAGARLDDASPVGVVPEFGLLMTTDNPDATAEFVENVTEHIANVFAPTTFEDGVGTIPLGALVSMPELASITLASNDDFLMFGTTDTVNFAIEPGDASVLDTDNYAYESGLFLEGTYTLFYINGAPLRDTANELIASGIIPDVSAEDAEIIDGLMRIFESSSITATLEDGVSRSRITLTLGE